LTFIYGPVEIINHIVYAVNITMNTTEQIIDPAQLIEEGNRLRSENRPDQALKCYMLAMCHDPDSSAAFNNYGNVLRECGQPRRGIPFLEHAAILDPNSVTARFNLAVSYLIMGDYARGWAAYESRWQYEHLAGSLPQHAQPRWTGQDLQGKTILVVGEQGHGDNIQFCRFLFNLHAAGARVLFQVTDGLIPLLSNSPIINWVGRYTDTPPEFDYWIPIMSIPGVLGITLENLPKQVQYINAFPDKQSAWLKLLGPKKRMRVGFSWSGRRDAWLNRHKSVPFENMLDMVKNNPQYEWINLQVDATPEEDQALADAGVTRYPGSIQSFADTAALIATLDVIISVDTAITHLAGALGRPTWLMLQWFGTDWRWMLDRDSSPWYSTVRIFRQPSMGDWTTVTKKIEQYLTWFKV
jgi:tetratricopeptide (TPR) repeat protein